MTSHYQIQSFAPDQMQSHKATVSSGVSSSSRSEAFKQLDVFGQLFQALMTTEVVGQGTGEVSTIYGTMQSTPRTDDRKLFSQPTSQTSRVKGVREEYNQDEHRNFNWMMQEAKKLKEILERFENILAEQGGF